MKMGSTEFECMKCMKCAECMKCMVFRTRHSVHRCTIRKNYTNTLMSNFISINDLPPDFIPQLIPASIGMTIALMCMVELTDHLQTNHARFFLLPLSIFAFTTVVITLSSLLAWYAHNDFELLRRELLTITSIRIAWHSIDAYVYVQRSRSIFMFYPKIRRAAIGFLGIRWVWMVIVQALDLVSVVRSWSGDDYLRTVDDGWTLAQRYTSLVAPAVQALLVDSSMLYVILNMLRKAGWKVYPSIKRIIRIVLLIVSSSVFMGIALTNPSSPGINSLVAAGAGSIVLPLSTFVNVDLFVLDISLFAQRPSYPLLPHPVYPDPEFQDTEILG